MEPIPADASPLGRSFDRLSKGDVVESRGRTITEADVTGFATLTGDLHPQHVDATWAASSRFGERIAHGALTLSYGFGLLPLDPERVQGLRRIADAAFTRPVRIGDTIRVEGRIDALTPVDDASGVVGMTLRTLNQEGQLVCRVRVELLWAR